MAKEKNKKESQESIFTRNIQRGIDKNIITLSEDQSKITYHCSEDFTTSFKDPEEKVRGSYFAELVLDYEYPQKRIDFEVELRHGIPKWKADTVIYEDDELKKAYLVVECKKDGITDAEFKRAIEQAFGNANSLRAKFASVVASNYALIDATLYPTYRRPFDLLAKGPSRSNWLRLSDEVRSYFKGSFEVGP